MQSPRSSLPAVLALVVGLGLLLLPARAAAQASPCAPGQPPGRPPGEPRSRLGRPPTRPPQYPPGQCQLRLSRSAVAAGGELIVAGEGYAPGSSVELNLAGRTLAAATVSGDGTFVREVTVPADVRPGTYRVEAAGIAGTGGAHVLAAVLTVISANGAGAGAGAGRAPGVAVARPPEQLPRTGATTGALAAGASVLVCLGAALVVAARQRSVERR